MCVCVCARARRHAGVCECELGGVGVTGSVCKRERGDREDRAGDGDSETGTTKSY